MTCGVVAGAGGAGDYASRPPRRPSMNHRTHCSSVDSEHRAAAPVEAGGRGDGGRLLAEVMSLNAIFSALSGLALATGAPPLAGWSGIPVWLVSSLGLGLLGFAIVLVWLLATPHRLRTGAWFVVAADLAWIVGAVLLIGLVPRALPPSGDAAIRRRGQVGPAGPARGRRPEPAPPGRADSGCLRA